MIEEEQKELEVKLDDSPAENEREIKVEETKKVPAYSDDMPYSEKVRKRIAKEVAKRAEAEQRTAELEEKLEETQRKTFDIASKSLSNQLKSVSSELKQ